MIRREKVLLSLEGKKLLSPWFWGFVFCFPLIAFFFTFPCAVLLLLRVVETISLCMLWNAPRRPLKSVFPWKLWEICFCLKNLNQNYNNQEFGPWLQQSCFGQCSGNKSLIKQDFGRQFLVLILGENLLRRGETRIIFSDFVRKNAIFEPIQLLIVLFSESSQLSPGFDIMRISTGTK